MEVREIKFRGWHTQDNKMFSAEEMAEDQLTIMTTGNFINVSGDCQSKSTIYDRQKFIPLQFSGLTAKNGKEIYEGDIVRYKKPYRTTQTHEGDNIPNGSYIEPLEPAIQTIEGEVCFSEGCFSFSDLDKADTIPLIWCVQNWDEESIKDAISYGHPDRFIWDDVEEGDMQYLIEENKLTDLQSLIDFLSGIEIIGNIYENPELQTS